MNQEQYAKANAAIERLVELYPRTFFLLGRNRWPLKIGIFDDLVVAGIMEPGELELAFGLYCRSFGYRRAMRVGAARLNLAAEPMVRSQPSMR
jgi:sRNA-binding protein